MKKLRSLIALISLIKLFSFGKKEPDYSKVLPNVVKVTSELYYDQSEISNLNWIEYLNWHARHNGRTSKEYKEVMPDTGVWEGHGCCDSSMIKQYLRHPAWRDYPVVGITQIQAMNYCEWRTERVIQNLSEKNRLKKAPAKFVYRLPTLKEWKMMYEDLADLPVTLNEGEYKRNCDGCYRYNVRKRAVDNEGYVMKTEDYQITAPAFSYWPNKYGVYNAVGNVSEWVQEENMHIGGSWNTYEDEDPSVPQKLDSASAKVGFRCVCEILSDEA
ncbi:MAG: hypothetical protein Salg2KO_15830 [Salibacteraceae bacterium]